MVVRKVQEVEQQKVEKIGIGPVNTMGPQTAAVCMIQILFQDVETQKILVMLVLSQAEVNLKHKMNTDGDVLARTSL